MYRVWYFIRLLSACQAEMVWYFGNITYNGDKVKIKKITVSKLHFFDDIIENRWSFLNKKVKF